MPKIFPGILFLLIFFAMRAHAQDTLPNISVKNVNDKIIISWKNNYGGHVSNINIQRSADSLQNFTTIATVLNPNNKENGIVDPKPPGAKIFYRVFVAFEGGSYVFSKSHRPVMDTVKYVSTENEQTIDIPAVSLPTPAPPVNAPGKFIYTGKDNNVIINLPNATVHKYSVKFFEENNKLLFEINTIPEPFLILDKANFMHSGWFNYSIYDDGILVENYRLFIPKDVKVSH